MIHLKNAKKEYRQSSNCLTVFKDLNISFPENKITAVLGPSGCGKSTLLRTIAGLEKLSGGKIYFKKPNQRIGMIFQEYTALPWRTIEKNITFGLENLGTEPDEQKEKTEYWLEKTGLKKFRDYYPSQLSGGMKQRLAFARCLAVNPSILLMDEPFGSLDAISREKMTEFSEHLLGKMDVTSVFVTHSIREAILFADRIIVLSNLPCTVKMDVEINFERPRRFDMLLSATSMDIESQVREILISREN